MHSHRPSFVPERQSWAQSFLNTHVQAEEAASLLPPAVPAPALAVTHTHPPQPAHTELSHTNAATGRHGTDPGSSRTAPVKKSLLNLARLIPGEPKRVPHYTPWFAATGQARAPPGKGAAVWELSAAPAAALTAPAARTARPTEGFTQPASTAARDRRPIPSPRGMVPSTQRQKPSCFLLHHPERALPIRLSSRCFQKRPNKFLSPLSLHSGELSGDTQLRGAPQSTEPQRRAGRKGPPEPLQPKPCSGTRLTAGGSPADAAPGAAIQEAAARRPSRHPTPAARSPGTPARPISDS